MADESLVVGFSITSADMAEEFIISRVHARVVTKVRLLSAQTPRLQARLTGRQGTRVRCHALCVAAARLSQGVVLTPRQWSRHRGLAPLLAICVIECGMIMHVNIIPTGTTGVAGSRAADDDRDAAPVGAAD